ncbi:MAG TPA: DUF2061 domain-containing protein [Sphingomonas sp.]|nr:DUF2061 domain-containing protein [Sphingomonas sp.]
MPRDLLKTLTYLSIHLTVGFTVAYAFTGSLSLAGGIALIEPCINAVAFFFHEQAWKRVDRRPPAMDTESFIRGGVAHV